MVLPWDSGPGFQECGEGRARLSAAGLAELCGHSRCDVRLLCAPAHGQVCGPSVALLVFKLETELELPLLGGRVGPAPRCLLACFLDEVGVSCSSSRVCCVPGALSRCSLPFLEFGTSVFRDPLFSLRYYLGHIFQRRRGSKCF